MDVQEKIRSAQDANPGKRIDCYVLFSSHTDAMRLYELARADGLDVRVSTTPRQARACCGVALLVSCDQAARIQQVAQGAAVPLEDIVALPNQINPNRDVYC